MKEQKASNRRLFYVPIDDLKPMFITRVRPSEAEKTKDILLLTDGIRVLLIRFRL